MLSKSTLMNTSSAILLLILALVQSQLWRSEGGLLEYWKLKQAVMSRLADNHSLVERNAALMGEVADLKNGYDAIEERARSEMGMIKEGEQFFQIINTPRDTNNN